MDDSTTDVVAAADQPAKAAKKAPAKKKVAAKKAPAKKKGDGDEAARAPAEKKAPAKKGTSMSPSFRQDVTRAANLLKSASDPTRLFVLLSLAKTGPQHVGGLCENLASSQPAVSHHLALLRHGRLIEPQRKGKNNFYDLTEQGRALAEAVTNLMAS